MITTGEDKNDVQKMNAHKSDVQYVAGALRPSTGIHDGSHVNHVANALAGNANVWQRQWSQHNDMKDGFFYTDPASTFEPNHLGIYDMIGNV